MSVGFTGTRQGMTESQKKTIFACLEMILEPFGPEFRHGACHGADIEAANIATAMGYVEEPFPAGDDPLGRNRIIVNGASFMLATPSGFKNIMRGSGTWYTIRYSSRKLVPGLIIWPDGMASPITARRHPYYDPDEG